MSYRIGMGDYFARGNPCIPESTMVPPEVLHEGGGRMYGLGWQVDGMYGGMGSFAEENPNLLKWLGLGLAVLIAVKATSGYRQSRPRRFGR